MLQFISSLQNYIRSHIYQVFVLYSILSFKSFITLANTTCKFPEDGVLAPKHVAVILIILHCLFEQMVLLLQ